MAIGLSIRAFVCRSTQAAVSLAEKNPARYSSFANRLISAKNTKVESSLFKAEGDLKYFRSTANDFCKLNTFGSGAFGSKAAASRAASLSVDWLQDKMHCELVINQLSVKKSKYDGLANALANVVGASQAMPAVPVGCRTPEYTEPTQWVNTTNRGVYYNEEPIYSVINPYDSICTVAPGLDLSQDGYDTDNSKNWY